MISSDYIGILGVIMNEIKILKENTKNCYAPYSKFKVSAVLVTKSGKLYTGVNVENASYGATICAERVAILKAVSEGEKDFEKIYLYVEDCNGNHPIVPPCGICRQVMSEFAMDMEVIMVGDDEKIETSTVRELLPHHFDNNFLK
jgi:cytidine deaminase